MKDFSGNLSEYRGENKQVFLFFTASWCASCRALKPTVEKLIEDRPDILFLSVSTDDYPDFSNQFHIKTLPTVVKLDPQLKAAEDVRSGNISRSMLSEFIN